MIENGQTHPHAQQLGCKIHHYVWRRELAYDLIVRRLDPPALYAALDMEKVRRGLTWDQVAAEAGVNVGTIRRLRANGRFETDGILFLTQWLGRPVEEFTDQSGL